MESAKSGALSPTAVQTQGERSAIGSRAVSPKNVSQSDYFTGITSRAAAASGGEAGLPGRACSPGVQ